MNKRLIFRIVVILLLCGLCFFCSGAGFILLIQQLERHSGIRIGRMVSTEEFIETLLYLFSVTVLPLFVISLWKFIPVYSIRNKVLSVLIILGCLSLSISVRIALITRYARLRQSELSETNRGAYRFPPPVLYSDQLNLWLFVAAAYLLAAGVIYLLLRERKNEVVSFSFESDHRGDSR